MRLSLDKLIDYWKKTTPNGIAISVPDWEVTYGELWKLKESYDLSSLDPNKRYGLIIQDNIVFISLLIAMIKEKLLFVTIGDIVDNDRKNLFLSTNKIDSIITDDDFFYAENVNLINVKSIKRNKRNSDIIKEQNMDDIVGGFLSSGSTGLPKVYYRNQYSIISEALLWIFELQLIRGIRFFLSEPFSYSGSFVLLYSVLYAGGNIIIPRTTRVEKDLFQDTDFAFFTPKTIRKLIYSEKKYNIKNIITMGAPISLEEKRKMSEKYSCNVYEMWGNSEGLATITNIYDNPDGNHLGRSTFTDEIFIVNKEGIRLPINNVGYIAGITDNGTSADEDKECIISEDLGYLDEYDNLYFVGRENEVVIFPDGTYYSNSDFEKHIVEELGCNEIVLILKDSKINVFVQKEYGSVTDKIQKIFERYYSNYKNCISFGGTILVEKIPYNANGKIDYCLLKEIQQSQEKGCI